MRYFINLLDETIDAIFDSGHTAKDIVFIGSLESGHSCTWEEFKTLADVEYDDGFGAQKVAYDLVICFSDGTRLWRREYDGSESWDFIRPVALPTDRKTIRRLIVEKPGMIGWYSLKGLNDES
jgi:hypothetical protein